VTLVPAAFLLGRGDDGAADEPSSITLVGGQPSGTAESAAEETERVAPDATDVMGTAPVDALHSDQPVSTDDGATIAIPRMPRSVSGAATFSRNIGDASHCYAAEVTFGARITVTNLDNDQSVDCINDVGGTRPDEAVVLHPDAFLQIADLTDAPVPVQITW
jgi:hypothetical protein